MLRAIFASLPVSFVFLVEQLVLGNADKIPNDLKRRRWLLRRVN
jgi:hypothetical protein